MYILNGPNLNLVGIRETGVYGTEGFAEWLPKWRGLFPNLDIVQYQSNHEGELIDFLQAHGFETDALFILNAGAYTHTSLALADCIAAISVPVIEVHISNIFARESIRHTSLIAPKCIGSISGFGMHSYTLALHQAQLLLQA